MLVAHAAGHFLFFFELVAPEAGDVGPCEPQDTRTTVVPETVTCCGTAHPNLANWVDAASISSDAVDPFIASSSPRGPTRGIAQPRRRSNGASARAVTTSNDRVPCRS